MKTGDKEAFSLSPNGKMTPEEMLKKDLGVDWFNFQTSIRKLVLELIEPTVKRTMDDHHMVQSLNLAYEKLKKREEDFEHTTVKQLNRTATLDDLNNRVSESVR